jgi:hypothetical protein
MLENHFPVCQETFVFGLGKKNRFKKFYCSFAYSALACFRMGMSGSASFQRREGVVPALDSILQSQCGEMLPLLLLRCHE